MRYFLISILLFSSFVLSAKEINTFSIDEETDSSITIHFQLPQYSFSKITIDSIIYDFISLSNCQYTNKKSNPKLPKLSTSLLIPEDATISFEIINSKSIEYSKLRIIPSGGTLKRETTSADIIEGEQYKKNELYPSSPISLEKPFKIRDNNGIGITIYPFLYNAVTGKLTAFTELTITISFNTINKNNIPESDFNVAYQFLNQHHYSLKSNATTYHQSSMLILSPSKYNNSDLKKFIAWKNRKGIITELIETDTVTNSSQFQTVINKYYLKNKNTYLLLVGNTTDIPQIQNSDASDNAYGFIEGNDTYPEIIVGRLIANSPKDIQTQTQKIMNYEMRAQNDTLVSNYVMVASDQGSSSNIEKDYEHLRNIATKLKSKSYNGGDELYDGSQGGNDAIGNPTNTMLVNSINQGKGVFLYTGHSSGNTLTTTKFTSSNSQDFTNTQSFPLGIIAGCQAGNISIDTCIAQACVCSHKNDSATGMVAMLASTVDQWWNPPMAGQDIFAESLINENNIDTIPSFGLIALKSFIYMNDKFQQEGYETTNAWSIFGDPSLQVFTKKAELTNITFNKNIFLGQDTLTIFSSTENLWISLSMNSINLGLYKILGAKVLAHFPTIKDTGTFVVTAYGFNIKPIIDSAIIVKPYNDFVSITNFSIKSSNIVIQNNDTASISLNFKNLGLSDANDYTVSLKSNDTNLSILNSTINLPTITSNTEYIANDCFKIKINDNTINQSKIKVTFTFTKINGSSYLIDEYFTINAPTLQYLGKTFIPVIGGNSTDSIKVGEIGKIGIIFKNIGDAPAKITEIKLKTENKDIFSYSNSTAKNLAIGQIDTVYITSIFPSTILNGTNIPIVIESEFNSRIYIVNETIKVGRIIETWEDSLMTNYQWTNETSKQWFISKTESYTSKFALQSGNITDNESTTISLSLNVVSNDSISFMTKTSCETPQFLTDHYSYSDYLDFRIDGNSMIKKAGLTNWEKATIPVTSGFHTFSWTYIKDYDASEGTDAVWIDDIYLPLNTGTKSQLFAITSTSDTVIKGNNQFIYSITTNKQASISIFKKPSWLIFDNINTLSGIPNNEATDTIIIVATSENEFTNQIIIIRSTIKTDIKFYSTDIELFPNPAQNTIYIKNNKNELFEYEIKDILGECVMKENANANEISISNLSPGTYFFTIKENDKSSTVKFIKQ